MSARAFTRLDLTHLESPRDADLCMATLLAERSLSLDFPAPHPLLRACVVIPARDEQASVGRLIAALASQRDLQGWLLPADHFEVLLLLNNCTDQTAAVLRQLQRQFPTLRLHFAEITFPPEAAHVGSARQALFDTAFLRFQALERPHGLILTTDADSQPAPDWIAQTEAEIAAGVVGVGGRILLDPAEQAALPAGVRRHLVVDIGYRRALEEMRSLYAPDAHDPFPRHHQHFGGSLAVTAAAYARAGGMPAKRSNEDVALYRAIVGSGGSFRHSYRVRVTTSARMIGRAQGGLADALGWWNRKSLDADAVLVESATAAEMRLAALGHWRADHPAEIPPLALTTTPEPPPAGSAAEIHATVEALRIRCAALRPLALAERLQNSRRDLPRVPLLQSQPA